MYIRDGFENNGAIVGEHFQFSFGNDIGKMF